MDVYKEYLQEIEVRKKQGLKPKPIDDGILLSEIIKQIKDSNSILRSKSIEFFKYNVYRELQVLPK